MRQELNRSFSVETDELHRLQILREWKIGKKPYKATFLLNMRIWFCLRRLLLMLRLSCVLLAASVAIAAPDGAVEIINARAKDIDTITGDAVLQFDIVVRGITIRAGDFDGAEASRTRSTVVVSNEELIRGQAGKLALNKLIATAKHVWVQPYKKLDKFGRKLGVIYVDDLPLKTFATDGNYLRPTDPPKEKKP